MTGFSAEWLAMREPVDAAARHPSMTGHLSELLHARSVACFDLGCGTGANVRYLAPLIAVPQRWVLVDSDERHLQRTRELMADWSRAVQLVHSIETRRADLAMELDQLGIEEDALVSASALLDLVSADWLAQLLQRCSARHAIVLFALSYDGSIELNPREPDDELICELVNRHQRTDKGFGPALGPAAVSFACAHLEGLRYHVRTSRSDWVLDGSHAPMQEYLLRGWVQAAIEMAASQKKRCERWLTTRLDYLQRGRSFMRVGHQDVLGWPSAGAVSERWWPRGDGQHA